MERSIALHVGFEEMGKGDDGLFAFFWYRQEIVLIEKQAIFVQEVAQLHALQSR